MTTHREENATLVGEKILVICTGIKKRPTLLATKGRDRGQYMIVAGDPAFAVIDIRLSWISKR